MSVLLYYANTFSLVENNFDLLFLVLHYFTLVSFNLITKLQMLLVEKVVCCFTDWDLMF